MLKEVMTSFDVAAVTHEINELTKGAHVAKIYQIGTQTLLLKLRIPKLPRLQLLIEAGKRLHLTSYVHETPKKPSAFCMSLRKYLDNGVIKEVRQHEFERIAVTEISTRQGDFQLVSELFGAGNVILVDPEGKILQAMTYKRMRDRNILRGEPFQHPPARGRNPSKLNKQEFRAITKLDETETVRGLTNFLSISGTYAEEILFRAEINKERECGSLTDQEVDGIFTQIQKLLALIDSGTMEPYIVNDEKSVWIDVTPVPLKRYEQFEQKKYESFNSALDDYYAKMTAAERREEISEEVESEVSRYTRILERQQKALENLKEPIIKNKAIGDLIYMHFGELQSLLQKIIEEKRSGESWEQIISQLEEGKKANRHPDIYFHSLEPKNQLLHVSVDNHVFSINLRHPIQANANKYYSRSKKAEKKLRGAEKTLQETKAKIEKAQKQAIQQKETQRPLVKRRKRQWFEKFRWFHSSNGFLVIGGRDATTNELLIKRRMEPHDIVFHAEILGAPFVLIKTEGKTVPEQTINEAAQLAASYSRAWREMLSAVNVYWVHPVQVSKTPPSGQFLKKGAFMISGSKNFVRGVPLKVAIGVKIEDDEMMVAGGPVDAIANQTEVYVEIVPGDQKSSQLAKQIRHQLSTKVPEDLKRSVTQIPIEEFQRFIPLGRGKMG
ncbi:MAG TPA: fibronectin-binding domain-containing protein [Candidatus Bathyarchaeota archaeon]|nr:fibronectin-binding domain-containing protein [Candidatus Bathyarchaeota archaeon]